MKRRNLKTAGIIFILFLCTLSFAIHAQISSKEFENKLTLVSEQIRDAQSNRESFNNHYQNLRVKYDLNSVVKSISNQETNPPTQSKKSYVKSSRKTSTYKSKYSANYYKKTFNYKSNSFTEINSNKKSKPQKYFNYYSDSKPNTSTQYYYNYKNNEESNYKKSGKENYSGYTNSDNVHVNGYYKNNGTYVKEHYRTKANNDKSDNFSSKGNINPYTGKKGYK